MRASEALLLGSTMLKPRAGVYWDQERTEGCAMGMIAVANGNNARTVPPWMNAILPLPCACSKLPRGSMIMMGGCNMGCKEACNNAHQIIVHLFNYHVMTTQDWTIEQLADWLRTVEPREENENGHDHHGSACGDQNHREAAGKKETSGAR